jgi:hypothetical protein
VLDEKGAGLRLGRVKSSEKRGPWSVALFVLHQQGEELTNLWSALQSIDYPWQPIGRMLAHRIVCPQLPEGENQVSIWLQLNWIERGFYRDSAVFQNGD